MEKLVKDNCRPDKTLAAVCGLFCPSCTLYIANREDPERLRMLKEQFGASDEDIICRGCRSDVLSFHCRQCRFRDCAAGKSVEFCSQCAEFPCSELKAFQAERPHRAELWDSLEQIRKDGWVSWYAAMAEMSSCGECGTVNSAYDLDCRICGSSPGSPFADSHGDKVLKHLQKVDP